MTQDNRTNALSVKIKLKADDDIDVELEELSYTAEASMTYEFAGDLFGLDNYTHITGVRLDKSRDLIVVELSSNRPIVITSPQGPTPLVMKTVLLDE